MNFFLLVLLIEIKCLIHTQFIYINITNTTLNNKNQKKHILPKCCKLIFYFLILVKLYTDWKPVTLKKNLEGNIEMPIIIEQACYFT